jgi:hypothetical protein
MRSNNDAIRGESGCTTTHPDARSEILLAGFALALIGAQWVLSGAIHATNYYGIDGMLAQSAALAAFTFSGIFDVTSLGLIQGVGSQLLPKNVWANPAFWPFALLDKEIATDVSALIALACFAGAFLILAMASATPRSRPSRLPMPTSRRTSFSMY